MDPHKKASIKQWIEADRPREKLMLKGASALSDAELIAILIGSGNRKQSAIELSQEILGTASNNLVELSKYTLADLMKFNGIGEAKAITIVAALEIGRRRRAAQALERKKIKTSGDMFEVLQEKLSDNIYERFFVMMLNAKHELIKLQEVSQGGMTQTIVDPKIVFLQALENKATSIIIAHNHPSEDVKPSQDDIKITKKLQESGRLLEIPLLDHIIVGGNSYFSFHDKNLL